MFHYYFVIYIFNVFLLKTDKFSTQIFHVYIICSLLPRGIHHTFIFDYIPKIYGYFISI